MKRLFILFDMNIRFVVGSIIDGFDDFELLEYYRENMIES
jgi:hypothetical protein